MSPDLTKNAQFTKSSNILHTTWHLQIYLFHIIVNKNRAVLPGRTRRAENEKGVEL